MLGYLIDTNVVEVPWRGGFIGASVAKKSFSPPRATFCRFLVSVKYGREIGTGNNYDLIVAETGLFILY